MRDVSERILLTDPELLAAHAVAKGLLDAVLEEAIRFYNLRLDVVIYALHVRLVRMLAESGRSEAELVDDARRIARLD